MIKNCLRDVLNACRQPKPADFQVHVVLNAYNERPFIERCLDTVYPYADTIAISDVSHLDGVTLSNDGTHELLMDYMRCKDPEKKMKFREPKRLKDTYVKNQARIKTDLMELARPRNGDWIWIVEADEFYTDIALEHLRGRYILGHQSLKYNKHFLCVTALVFAYDLHHCFFAYHGRFFRYKKGSYFLSSNHFCWPEKAIYDDRYRWDIPAQYMTMYHLKYVKPLDRLMARYRLHADDMGNRKAQWFKNVFWVYPFDPELAYANNKRMFDASGFDTGLTGRLFYYDGVYPKHVLGIETDLQAQIRARGKEACLSL